MYFNLYLFYLFFNERYCFLIRCETRRSIYFNILHITKSQTLEMNFQFGKHKMLYSARSGEYRGRCTSIIQYFAKYISFKK